MDEIDFSTLDHLLDPMDRDRDEIERLMDLRAMREVEGREDTELEWLN